MDGEATMMPNTKIVFALDRRQLEGIRVAMSDLDDRILTNIPRLEKGTAVITGARDLIRHTVYVRIYAERKASVSPTPPSFFEDEGKWMLSEPESTTSTRRFKEDKSSSPSRSLRDYFDEGR